MIPFGDLQIPATYSEAEEMLIDVETRFGQACDAWRRANVIAEVLASQTLAYASLGGVEGVHVVASDHVLLGTMRTKSPGPFGNWWICPQEGTEFGPFGHARAAAAAFDRLYRTGSTRKQGAMPARS